MGHSCMWRCGSLTTARAVLLLIPLSALALGFWNGEKFGFKFVLFHLHAGWLCASGFPSLSLRFFIPLNGDNNTPFIMRLRL